jgi:hypothetical protein
VPTPAGPIDVVVGEHRVDVSAWIEAEVVDGVGEHARAGDGDDVIDAEVVSY